MLEVEETTETIDITPHPSLISKLGATGYKTYEAIAELIDNSIDARVDSKSLKVHLKLDVKNRTIIVEDNGKGMDFETLKEAMTLAHVKKDRHSQLGVYGIGMKTACSSLSENFCIDTKPVSENTAYECCYKEREWINGDKEKWANFPITVKDSTTTTHGTSIKLEKLKVSLYPNLVGNFRRIFGVRYGPFLKNGLLEIWVNTLKCETEEPKIILETKREFNLRLPSGTITGWGALLEKRQGGRFGFHLYKNDRLVKMYDKNLLGREAHSAISLIIGELNLDHVPTLYNKTDFLPESKEFREVIENFSGYEKFKDLKREALQPAYAKEISKLTKERISNITLNFLKQVDNLEKNNYPFPKDFKKERAQKILEYDLNLLGKKERIIVTLAYFDNISLKKVKIGNQVEISINQNSPAYSLAKNKTSFVSSQIAESLAYIIAKKSNAPIEKFLEISDKFVNASVMEAKTYGTKQTKKKDLKTLVELKNQNEKELLVELRDVNKSLKKSFGDEAFYFTATSTLEKYLTHIPRVSYYLVYCDVGIGEKIRERLIEEFNDNFLTVLHPSSPKKLDLNYLENLTENTGINKIIIIREKERENIYRREGSVASLEIALVDLVLETVKNKLPIFTSDIQAMFLDLKNSGNLNKKKLRRYATQRNVWSFFKKVGD